MQCIDTTYPSAHAERPVRTHAGAQAGRPAGPEACRHAGREGVRGVQAALRLARSGMSEARTRSARCGATTTRPRGPTPHLYPASGAKPGSPADTGMASLPGLDEPCPVCVSRADRHRPGPGAGAGRPRGRPGEGQPARSRHPVGGGGETARPLRVDPGAPVAELSSNRIGPSFTGHQRPHLRHRQQRPRSH